MLIPPFHLEELLGFGSGFSDTYSLSGEELKRFRVTILYTLGFTHTRA